MEPNIQIFSVSKLKYFRFQIAEQLSSYDIKDAESKIWSEGGGHVP